MKKSIVLLYILGVFFALTSCETLKDPEVELGPVYPLSGEWIVRYIKVGATLPSDTSTFATISTFNAADNSTTSLWVRKTSTTASTILGAYTVKSNCNVGDKSFSVTDGVNTVLASGVSVGKITITEGKVTLNGWATKSGHYSDKITFKITDTRKPGLVYMAEGYRRTGWYEDEP